MQEIVGNGANHRIVCAGAGILEDLNLVGEVHDFVVGHNQSALYLPCPTRGRVPDHNSGGVEIGRANAGAGIDDPILESQIGKILQLNGIA